MAKLDVTAIILAGGSGSRMGEGKTKQYLTLGTKPLINHSIDAFEQHPLVKKIVLVVPKKDIDYCRNEIVCPYGYKKIECITTGGATRQESSYLGIKASQSEFVMIHDGARPFIDFDLITRLAESLERYDAVIPAVAVTDTIKYIEPGGAFITSTPDRSCLWAAQTPQAFKKELIANAHCHAEKTGFIATDDASLVENAGGSVFIIQGSKRNIKITTKEDLAIAEFLSMTEEANEKH